MPIQEKNTPIAKANAPQSAEPKLLDRVRDKIRLKHYSIRTEKTYLDWIKRFILFHRKRHPAEMGAAEVEAFLSHLAVVGNVAASAQNQAKAALLFLYREVLAIELPWLDNVEQAKVPRRLPVVLTQGEVKSLLERLQGTPELIARLLYGTWVRLMECMRLRVKDVQAGRDMPPNRNVLCRQTSFKVRTFWDGDLFHATQMFAII